MNIKNRNAAQWKKSGKLHGSLVISYTQTGTLFPPEIVPLTVTWQEENAAIKNRYINVTSGSEKGLVSAFTEQQSWKPDSSLWKKIKQHGHEQPVIINVLAFDKGQIQFGSNTIIRTSPDSVNASIFFRAIPLPFDYAQRHIEEIRLHWGDISCRSICI